MLSLSLEIGGKRAMLKKIPYPLFSMTVITTVMLLTGVAWAQKVVTDGLIGFWTLDKDTIDGNTVSDSLGKNHGEIFGDPEIVEGKINGALEFDGKDDYIDLPNMENEVAVTMELWTKLRDSLSAPDNRGLVSSTLWQAGVVHFKMNPEFPVLVDKADGGKVNTLPKIQNLEQDRWYHCAYTCDTEKNELMLYIDGELMNTAASGTTPVDLTSLRIGSEFDGRYFPGTLDEIRIYNRALSEDEIKQNYNVKSSAVNPSGKFALCWGDIKL